MILGSCIVRGSVRDLAPPSPPPPAAAAAPSTLHCRCQKTSTIRRRVPGSTCPGEGVKGRGPGRQKWRRGTAARMAYTPSRRPWTVQTSIWGHSVPCLLSLLVQTTGSSLPLTEVPSLPAPTPPFSRSITCRSHLATLTLGQPCLAALYSLHHPSYSLLLEALAPSGPCSHPVSDRRPFQNRDQAGRQAAASPLPQEGHLLYRSPLATCHPHPIPTPVVPGQARQLPCPAPAPKERYPEHVSGPPETGWGWAAEHPLLGGLYEEVQPTRYRITQPRNTRKNGYSTASSPHFR